jgi:RNA polymerase sigma-70 factor (ECF subfamily)
MAQSDAQLVRDALSGTASAFEALHAAHGGRIQAYFLRSGFRPADADDLTQETFLRAYRSLGTFDAGRGAFSAWLSAIARNVARRRFARRRDPQDFDPQLAEDTLAATENPAETAAGREEVDAVRDCVAELPEELGRLVRLRYVEARTTRGVSRAAGLPEATVRLRLGEARAAIRRCLKSKGILR